MKTILNDLSQRYQNLKNELFHKNPSGHLFVDYLESHGESEIEHVRENLVESFQKWKAHIDGSVPFVAVRFYWAGAEVDPYIPSTVWSYLYGGDSFQGLDSKAKKIFLKEGPAFEPTSLVKLSNGELGKIPDHLFHQVKDIYITSSLIFASKALNLIKEHPQFLALNPLFPFHFIATSGHDEPPILMTVFK